MATAANPLAIKDLVMVLADSKPYSRVLLRSMLLQLEPKAIHEVADGAAVLDAIYAFSPDIVILDWDLQGLGAREVLRMVRAPGVIPNRDLPIVVVSSSGQSGHVHEAIQLGAQQFMVRPISPKMLGQRLRGLVTAARKAARAYNIQAPRAPGTGAS